MSNPTTELRLVLKGNPPSQDDVERRLSTILTGAPGRDVEHPVWKLDSPDLSVPWSLEPVPTVPLSELHITPASLEGVDVEAVTRSTWSLALRAPLPTDAPVDRFELLLQIARAVAPDAIALIDPEGGTVRPISWLIDVAVPGIPLRLDALYRIHAVTDDNGNAWLHTHGLRRCGIPDLEMLAVPEAEVHAAGALLQTVVHRALVHGLPNLGLATEYGHDFEIALVPWTYAHPAIASETGGPSDRSVSHPEDNLVLVAWVTTGPTTGTWRTAAHLVEEAGDNPVFYLTSYETDRMEALARLRWGTFTLLANHLVGLDGWRFLAKFGYGGEGDTHREHLWFEVERADAAGAQCRLLNDPHQDLGMNEGDEGRHDLDRLTDFVIASPLGNATPETIDRLMRRWMATMDAVGD
jgi:hypothetical protein